MPTYDYTCKFCGEAVEVFQTIVAKPLVKCPACKRRGLQRQIGTGAGIIFKGSGFYQTDYKNNGGKKEKESSESPSKKEKPAEKSKESTATASTASKKSDD